MFQIFGDEVYNSNAILDILKNNYSFDFLTDLTKSTEREDTLAFKCSVPVKTLNLTVDENDLEAFDNALSKCEIYVNNILYDLKIKYSEQKVHAYRYDSYNDSIICIICIMYVESSRKKLGDVLKRLIKNND